MSAPTTSVHEDTRVHVAAEPIWYGDEKHDTRVVQRCAWCGETLINEVETRLLAEFNGYAYEGVTSPIWPYWPAGELVRLRRRGPVVVGEWLQATDWGDLPEDACLLSEPPN